MASETGHARNVQRFEEMISFVIGYGGDYKPANPSIVLAALQAVLAAAQAAIDGVSTTLGVNKTARNERVEAFDGIRKLTTRVVNSFAASGASAGAIEDAQGFKRKIDGKRAETLVDDPNTPEDESQGGISVSQQSYTQLVEHFDNLIELLVSDGNYAPNEAELQIATLQALSVTLKTANTNVVNTFTSLSNSRLTRDDVMYADTSGLVELADLVKKYVKSLYGADSPQYQQISGLQFTKPR